MKLYMFQVAPNPTKVRLYLAEKAEGGAKIERWDGKTAERIVKVLLQEVEAETGLVSPAWTGASRTFSTPA